MFVEWVIFLAFVFMVIRLATSKLEYNWETTSCSKSMLLVEINELNITDLLLWIIVQRLKLINVEHIIFECRAREDRVDVNNGCWWQKLSVTIITLVTTLVSLNLRHGFIRNFSLAFLLFWRRFGSTCSQTLFASSNF